MILIDKERVNVLIHEYTYTLDLANRLEAALSWCGGASDFCEGGLAHEGWKKGVLPLFEEIRERRKRLLHTLETKP
jgi:hypothetical protein